MLPRTRRRLHSLPIGPTNLRDSPSPASIRTPRLDLVPIDPSTIQLLLQNKRAEAERHQGLRLPTGFPAPDELDGFLPIQLHRMQATPERREWMARFMVTHNGEVIGHCGFHGPPEVIGRAEIGYTVFEPHRAKGYAKEAADALARWAFAHGAAEVYASISPDNAPSLAVVRALGFKQIGTQEDEVDGLELVFSLSRPDRPRPGVLDPEP